MSNPITNAVVILICTICAALLMSFIQRKMNKFYNWLHKISSRFIKAFSLPLSVDHISTIFLAAILGAILGVLF